MKTLSQRNLLGFRFRDSNALLGLQLRLRLRQLLSLPLFVLNDMLAQQEVLAFDTLKQASRYIGHSPAQYALQHGNDILQGQLSNNELNS